MAPDFFESDRLASDAEIAGQPEMPMDEPQAVAPRAARRSLFQIVCLQSEPKAKPPTSL